MTATATAAPVGNADAFDPFDDLYDEVFATLADQDDVVPQRSPSAEHRMRLSSIINRHRFLHGSDLGPAIMPGWLPIVDDLAMVLHGLLPAGSAYRVTHIGVRFSDASLLWQHTNAPSGANGEAVRRAVQDAVAQSRRTCMCCGGPGQLTETSTGWKMTLCSGHARELRRNGKLEWPHRGR